MKIIGNTVGATQNLPKVTTADNNKILMVVDGVWQAAELPVFEGGTGDGTEDFPFKIANAAQLRAFSARVNAGEFNTPYGVHVELTADIDIGGDEWIPIGQETAPFNGTFNGNGHTVSNFCFLNSENPGFFGYACGTIKNLTIDYAIIDYPSVVGVAKTTAFIVSYAEGVGTLNVENCVVGKNSEIVIDALNYSETDGKIGAIVGDTVLCTVNISKCVNYANITLVNGKVLNIAVGGIVGAARKGTIQNCVNYGTVSAADSKEVNGGGICGLTLPGQADAVMEVKDCINYGNVTGSFLRAGGIVGFLHYTAKAPVTFTNAFSLAQEVKATLTGGVAGVLIGYLAANSSYNNVKGVVAVGAPKAYGQINAAGKQSVGLTEITLATKEAIEALPAFKEILEACKLGA